MKKELQKGKQKMIECGIMHHIHHRPEDEGYKREITITGSMYSINLSSDNPEETIIFLCETALELLHKIKESDNHEETK